MSTTFVTPPHVIAAIHQLHEDIKPAVLNPKNAIENGTILVGWLTASGIAMNDATASDWYNAVNAEAAKLHWSVQPAKLREKNNLTQLANKTVVKQETETFVVAEKLNTSKAEKHLADLKTFGEIDAAIKAYSPRTHFGTSDFTTQAREQKRLSDWVKYAKGSYSAAYIKNWVLSEIEKLYTSEENKRERRNRSDSR